MGFLNFFKSKQDPLVEALKQQEIQRQEDLLQAHREVQTVWLEIAEKCKSLTELMKELRFEREVVEVVRTSQIEIPERKGIQEPNQAVEHIARMILAKDKDFRRHDPAWKDHFLNTIHHNVTANYPGMAFSVNQIEAVFDRLIGAGV